MFWFYRIGHVLRAYCVLRSASCVLHITFRGAYCACVSRELRNVCVAFGCIACYTFCACMSRELRNVCVAFACIACYSLRMQCARISLAAVGSASCSLFLTLSILLLHLVAY